MGLDWLSVEEKVYFEEVVSTVMKKDATEKSVGGLLKRSGLPTQVVKDIWTLVKHASILSLEEIMTLFKYIALAQAGIPLRAENLRLRVNLPRFEGVSLPSSQVYIEEGSFGEFQEEPLPESSVVSPSVEGRTKYLDKLDFPEPQQREGNQTKPFIVLRPLERKVIDDFPSPTDVEEEIPTPSFQTENSAPKKPQETDLLDFSDTTAPSPIKKPVESQEPDLLSDFFIPATWRGPIYRLSVSLISCILK